MQHRMTYHNIRNMIWQLAFSGGYGDKFNYSNLHSDEHSIEFEYSNDKDITDCVYCVMVDNMTGCEIFITVVMYRNDTRTELGVVLKGNDKDDVMTCESYEGYAVFRTRIHMIHHKATRRLLNRIYNRMMIPEMHKHVAENVRDELLKRKGNKDAEL